MFLALILSAALTGGATDAAQESTQTASSPQSVSVDVYRRDYEGAKTESEQRYDSSILSSAGGRSLMEGAWRVSGVDGAGLLALELRSDDGRLDGAWRSLQAAYGMNGSGFVSSIDLTGSELEVNYFIGSSHSPVILRLRKGGDNLWRGDMMDTKGDKTPIVMNRQ